ncbi:outer membrane protein assembly factor BamD [[Haemophilus] felis]|uniref:Outer membrane protein assembly factor BamD n=1 Tax=[Haemophilus] felis TaxID=123822 RepID=A0A1T0BBM4_9PAST|nr:outer membrane protein assembly factor BamD [[Haemophilus] felis]NBI41181.1 outer membrane protein assembly factor BamD [[Haemophilus] felis]NBI42796.1 outer membrane protein assembly factor BamD [[Haemophilus] felis]OOS07517.1 outer membrane protein assembly factor BamD [[Haemophilus] felis]
MRQLKSFALIALTAVAITACSGSKEQVEQAPEQQLLQTGKTHLESGNYAQAARYLEAVRNRFPTSANAEQSLLSLIYANYKMEDYTATLTFADRFLQEFPRSPYLDYVVYLAGLTNYSLAENFIQDLFKIDRATRENTSLKSAYANFQTLIQHFPNSTYVEDAKARMDYIREALARHELAIVKFYAKRNAHVAVANRVVGMMQVHPEAKSTYQALSFLKEAYQAMGLNELVAKTEKLIEDNKNNHFSDVEKPQKKELQFPIH